MRPLIRAAILLAGLLASPSARGDDAPCAPPPYGKCLTADQYAQVKQALQELDAIHKAPAEVTVQDPVVVIQDWQGRVYVNGGDKQPIRMKLKLSDTVDRDMAVTLETKVYYREKPPDPMFRLRIRAQAGLLAPQLIDAVRGKKQNFFDAGVGWDFFHLGLVNAAVHTGVFSSGATVGVDVTKNFGGFGGFALAYDGLRPSALLGLYFAFN